jgi:hypothetical protein
MPTLVLADKLLLLLVLPCLPVPALLPQDPRVLPGCFHHH